MENFTFSNTQLGNANNIGDNPWTNDLVYLVRLSQSHSSFRRPELETLAILEGIGLEFINYEDDSPFCIVKISSNRANKHVRNHSELHDQARKFISRSILAKGIYELYATATTYDELHTVVRSLPVSKWRPYSHVSFKFAIDAFCGKRSTSQQREIIESFSYLPFEGRIAMKNPEQEFLVFEEYELLTPEEHAALNSGTRATSQAVVSNTDGHGGGVNDVINTSLIATRKPKRLFFGRYIGMTQRDLIIKHDLKKRPYISTTSMDAELALVTANLALASPGKLFLDPFTGTGGFMVAAAELGAVVLGADIDGRSFRGKGLGLEKGIGANFRRYGLEGKFGDCLTADLTNSPFRALGEPWSRNSRWLDGIICDPPYGVREGLKVLGRRLHDPDSPQDNGRAIHNGPYYVNGVPSHTLPGFVAPKRPYSFNKMLDDILEFATQTLVDGGRLAFWMPVANDADEEFPVPQHNLLELRHGCVQVFNKWSRRLLVYQRLPGEVPSLSLQSATADIVSSPSGHRADELNQFRRMYFRGFQAVDVVENVKGDLG